MMAQTAEQAMERALAAAKASCQEAEVYYRRSVSSPVEFENNRLKSIKLVEDAGLALRVIKDGRVGFSTTNKLNDVDSLVRNALATAQFGAPANFELPGESPVPSPVIHDGRVENLDTEEMVQSGQELIGPIRAVDPQIQVFCTVARESREIRVMNTRGFAGAYRKTLHRTSFGGELVEGTNMLYVYDGRSSTALLDGLLPIVHEVAENFRIGRKNVDLRSGEYTVILTPHAVADLLQPVEACLDGKAVAKKISPWRDKIGQAIFHPSVSITDDGTLSEAVGSAPFDDEGVPMQETTLIRNGVLEGFYLDLSSARELAMRPTGNGLKARGLTATPTSETTNLVMAPGTRSYKELLAGVKEGVWIDLLMGTFAGNPYGGVVSGNILLGYKIENGQLVGRIKDCMFSVNAFTALKEQLAGISSERRWNDNQLLPYVMLEGVNIATRG